MSVDNSEQLKLSTAQNKIATPTSHMGPTTLLGVLEKKNFNFEIRRKKNAIQPSLGSSLYQHSHEILF